MLNHLQLGTGKTNIDTYTSCLSGFFTVCGTDNPFNDFYSAVLCGQIALSYLVIGYVSKQTLILALNCNDQRTRNSIHMALYLNFICVLTFRILQLLSIADLSFAKT